MRARVVKNKVAPPFRTAEFDIMFDSGINHFGDLVDLAASCGVVERQGAWFSFDKVRLGQGRDAACSFIRGNPDVCEQIRQAVVARVAEADKPPKAD